MTLNSGETGYEFVKEFPIDFVLPTNPWMLDSFMQYLERNNLFIDVTDPLAPYKLYKKKGQ